MNIIVYLRDNHERTRGIESVPSCEIALVLYPRERERGRRRGERGKRRRER